VEMALHVEAVHTAANQRPGNIRFSTIRRQGPLHGRISMPALLRVSGSRFWLLILDGSHADGAHRSFSHVIQDLQFSSLGIVLVAQLAKITTLVGSISCHEQKGPLTLLPANVSDSNLEPRIEDQGVAVKRIYSVPVDLDGIKSNPSSVVDESLINDGASEKGNRADSERRGSEHQSLPVESSTTKSSEKSGIELRVQSTPARRKKQKATNAIDDLFQGLM